MRPDTLAQHRQLYYEESIMFGNDKNSDVTSFIHDKKDSFPIGMHTHDFYEINIIYKGSGYHYIEKQCFDASYGDVFVIPPKVAHGYYTEDINNFQIINILIKTSFISKYKKEFSKIPGYSILFEIEPSLRTGISNKFFLHLTNKQLSLINDKLVELLQKNEKSIAYDIYQKGLIISIISRLSQFLQENYEAIISNSKKTDSAESTFILKSIEYMNSNYGQKISIEKLAQIASMSRSTYIRKFESIIKKSPIDYLISIRLKQACELLEKSDKSITEISLDCGFFDNSHFSKIFKSYYSISPYQYRKNTKI